MHQQSVHEGPLLQSNSIQTSPIPFRPNPETRAPHPRDSCGWRSYDLDLYYQRAPEKKAKPLSFPKIGPPCSPTRIAPTTHPLSAALHLEASGLWHTLRCHLNLSLAMLTRSSSLISGGLQVLVGKGRSRVWEKWQAQEKFLSPLVGLDGRSLGSCHILTRLLWLKDQR